MKLVRSCPAKYLDGEQRIRTDQKKLTRIRAGYLWKDTIPVANTRLIQEKKKPDPAVV